MRGSLATFQLVMDTCMALRMAAQRYAKYNLASMAPPEFPPVMMTVFPSRGGTSHAGCRGSTAAMAALTVLVTDSITPPVAVVAGGPIANELLRGFNRTLCAVRREECTARLFWRCNGTQEQKVCRRKRDGLQC